MNKTKVLMCLPVEGDPDRHIVPGSVVAKCANCGVAVYVAPSGQKLQESTTAIAVCMKCGLALLGKGEPGAAILSPPKEPETSKIASTPAAEAEGEGFSINFEWLNESLKEITWTDETTKSWLAKFQVDTRGSLAEVISRLNREQAEEFVKHIQDKVA